MEQTNTCTQAMNGNTVKCKQIVLFVNLSGYKHCPKNYSGQCFIENVFV